MYVQEGAYGKLNRTEKKKTAAAAAPTNIIQPMLVHNKIIEHELLQNYID